jgi:hypothetical protein
MSLRNIARKTPPALLSALLIAGCGGGGSTDTAGTAASSVVASGEITGFGSIYVNGVRYNTDNAEIYKDGVQVSDDRDLSEGMIVRVEGSHDGGASADRVYYEELIKGPVDTVDAGNSQMTVMGQTVHIDAGTVFDSGTSLANFLSGDIAEVSGHAQADGSIRATYVEEKSGASVNKYELIGSATGVDDMAKTFMIGGLNVSYATADVSDLPGGNPTEGMLVEVKDSLMAYTATSLSLDATKVEPINPLEGMDHDDELEIEGIVQDSSGLPDSFVMNDITVLITADTQVEFGDITLIQDGVRLEVEGYLDSTGTSLVADEIQFEDHDSRVSAQVSAVNTGEGTISLLSGAVTVQTTDTTEYSDDRDEDPSFDLSSIAVDDYLEIEGYEGTNGDFIATSVDRKETKSEVELRAVAQNIDAIAQQFDLAGITISVDSNTEFELDDDVLTTMEDFFNGLTEGLSIVQVKWNSFTDTSLAVDSAEIED